jgi:hypothetical protein
MTLVSWDAPSFLLEHPQVIFITSRKSTQTDWHASDKCLQLSQFIASEQPRRCL